jgi:LysM repeat protein
MLRSATVKAAVHLTVVAFSGALLEAQDPATPGPTPPQAATYVVRAGDTLWDIARQALGDPFLWPEIYRLNTDVVEDPHWIYPGEVLRLAQAVVAGAEPEVIPEAAPRRTVFTGDTIRGADDPRLVVGHGFRGPAVRTGEFLTAPYVDRVGGPEEIGRISFIGDVTRTPRERTAEFTAVQLGDIVTLDMKQPVTAGTRLLAFGVGDVLRDRDLREVGQLIYPVGVVRVERGAAAGQPVHARLVQQFSRVLVDQGLLPMAPPPTATERPAPIASSQVYTTLHMVNEPELASLTTYLIISGTTRDRLTPGDRVSFFRPATRTESGQMIAESEIARGQVIRVTEYATTVIVTGQQYSDLTVGTLARLIAKMP